MMRDTIHTSFERMKDERRIEDDFLTLKFGASYFVKKLLFQVDSKGFVHARSSLEDRDEGSCLPNCSVTRKNRQMSIKVGQK